MSVSIDAAIRAEADAVSAAMADLSVRDAFPESGNAPNSSAASNEHGALDDDEFDFDAIIAQSKAREIVPDETFSDPESERTKLTFKAVQEVNKHRQLYSTPHLNDKLYLHYQAIRRISGLRNYTEVESLFLNNNSITRIENLDHLAGKLRCLFLQDNVLVSCERINAFRELRMLNLANNQLESLAGIESLPLLNNLDASGNLLSSADAIRAVTTLPELSSLNLSKNRFEDPVIIDTVLIHVPKLQVLYLHGNDFLTKMSRYRKTVLNLVRTLTYLDDRPVDGNERELAIAYAQGGAEAEQATRERQFAKKEEHLEREREVREMWTEDNIGKRVNYFWNHNTPYPEKVYVSESANRSKNNDPEDFENNEARIDYLHLS